MKVATAPQIKKKIGCVRKNNRAALWLKYFSMTQSANDFHLSFSTFASAAFLPVQL